MSWCRTQTLDGDHSTTLVRPSQPWIDIERRPGPAGGRGRLCQPRGRAHPVRLRPPAVRAGAGPHRPGLAAPPVDRHRLHRWPIRSHCLSRRSDTWRFPDRRSRPPLRSASCCSPTRSSGSDAASQASRRDGHGWSPSRSGFCTASASRARSRNSACLRATFRWPCSRSTSGVELGQLAFIAVVLGVIALARRLPLPGLVERYALTATTYALGGLAAFWFVERVAGFWT